MGHFQNIFNITIFKEYLIVSKSQILCMLTTKFSLFVIFYYREFQIYTKHAE